MDICKRGEIDVGTAPHSGQVEFKEGVPLEEGAVVVTTKVIPGDIDADCDEVWGE